VELDTDKGIYLFFRRHNAQWLPALGEIHRITFARPAARLWKVKEHLSLLSSVATRWTGSLTGEAPVVRVVRSAATISFVVAVVGATSPQPA
jgi:hypothetical protein